ncbi:MAG: T9SS type A sorting domain-containing protein, partial [Bacteroidia bacterium]
AKFDGVNWYPMSYPHPEDGDMLGICAFKNKVYGIGNWYGHGFSLTAEYTQAGGWVPSFGVQGTTYKTIFGLARIDSLLFFYGRFTHLSTLYSPNIAAWSGTHLWGFGQGTGLTSYSDIENIKKFKGQNKIYVVGSYDNAGGMMINPGVGLMISELYADKWCIYGDTLDNTVLDVEYYNNDLIMGGAFWTINGDSVRKIAKWQGGSYTYSCSPYSMTSTAIGIDELSISATQVRVYPNPATNSLHIESENEDVVNSGVEITNALGQTVLETPYTNTIDVSGLSQGYYNIKISTQNRQTYFSKFIKE